MEQRAAIRFCAKLKKTATETEMLKSAYGEECLSRTSVFQWQMPWQVACPENVILAGRLS
jgi:hypothetical protein